MKVSFKEQVKSYKNTFDFYLRSKIPLSRRNYLERGSYTPPSFVYPEGVNKRDKKIQPFLRERNLALLSLYFLNEFLPYLKESTLLDILFHLDILDRVHQIFPFLFVSKKEDYSFLSTLDIGSKNFSYSIALYLFLNKIKNIPNNISLVGNEIDPTRAYRNFFTSEVMASYYFSLIPLPSNQKRYLGKNILNVKLEDTPYPHEAFDFITLFFPFVTKEPLLAWGLPFKYIFTSETIEKIHSMQSDSGYFLVAHPTFEEFQRGQTLLKPFFSMMKTFEIPHLLYADEKVYIILVKK